MNDNSQLGGGAPRQSFAGNGGAARAKLLKVRKIVLISLAVLAALAAVSQLVIPPLAENRIEDRLTDAGGTAEVSLEAFPAARLLFGHGDRIEVRGSGLNLDLERETQIFDNLDGFDEVDVSLADYRAGPFQIRTFELTRDGPKATYHLVLAGNATPADIAVYGADRLGLVGGPLLGAFAAQLTGNRPCRVDLDMQLQSEDGRVVVRSGSGTVCRLPAGLLAQVITSAIVVRL